MLHGKEASPHNCAVLGWIFTIYYVVDAPKYPPTAFPLVEPSAKDLQPQVVDSGRKIGQTSADRVFVSGPILVPVAHKRRSLLTTYITIVCGR